MNTEAHESKASCRFNKHGAPPPCCEFTICALYDGEPKHLVMHSCAYPNEACVIVKGASACNGHSCKGWYRLKNMPKLKTVKALDHGTDGE